MGFRPVLFGLGQRFLCQRRALNRFFFGLLGQLKIRFGLGQGRLAFFHGLPRFLGLCLAALLLLSGIGQQPLRRLIPRRQARDILGQLRQIAFTFLQNRRRLACRICRLFQTFVLALSGLFQFALFPLQTLHGFPSILVQTRLAFDITGQLFNPIAQRQNHLTRAIFLVFQGITLHLQALKNRA